MKNIIKSFICLSLSLTVYAPAASAKLPPAGQKVKGKGRKCKDVQQDLINQCKANGMAAGSTSAVAGDGSQQRVYNAGAEAARVSSDLSDVSEECKKSKKECEQCEAENKDDKQQEEKERAACAGAIVGAAGTIEQQSKSVGGDAGSMLGAAALMGAALAPAIMAAMKKDDKDDGEKQKLPAEADGTLRPDGSIDCSKPSAWQFQPCDVTTAETCKTAMEDARCKTFANRYCNAGGVNTAYCNTVVAYQFCTTGGGHAGCPSCDNLAKNTSTGCINDPAKNNCLQQNSPEETEKQRPMCPNDPVFAGGGGGAQVAVNTGAGAGTGTGGSAPPTNPNLPAPILPAGSNGQQAAINNPSGGSGQVAVMSVGGAAKQGRDAYNNNPLGSQSGGSPAGAGGGYAAMSAGGAKIGGSASGGGGSARDVASSGPAPDVGGQFSPNLFATSSQVIRNRCAAGRFNNCP